MEYDKHNVYICYPDNWDFCEKGMNRIDGMIQISNGDGAFWMLKKYPSSQAPNDIANEVLAAMRLEYQDMEVERVSEVMYDKFVTGFEMTFFYLDLMNEARVLTFDTGLLTYAIFWQTGNQLIIHADKEVPTDRVLDAITVSFLRGKINNKSKVEMKKNHK
ncbi:MAG: hypothetical protein LBC74_12270 [Planctomycetaceae bacterium]|jgi:hypothetical protein|nr:hypothetical protein [Planctomycetaceae bacterium]